MAITHVPGKDKGKIMLYALSTCPWCGKVKHLLGELGVAYDYEDVDLLRGEEREQVLKEVARWNKDVSFPVLVINDTKTIIGFREDDIRKVLS